MAISLNDILSITMEQTYLSRVMLNVFFYKVFSITGTPTYEEISDAFALAVLDLVNVMQVNTVSNVGITIKNETNGLDIFEDVNTAVGDVAAEGLPAFVAYGYKLVRTNALTRHGSKRFVGIPETWYNNGSLTSAHTTPSANLVNALKSNISVDGAVGDCVIQPVIVGRVFDEVENYYVLDLTRINPIANAAFSRVTSQVSRKYPD